MKARIIITAILLSALSSAVEAQDKTPNVWAYSDERYNEIVPINKIKVQDRRNHRIRMHSFCTNLGIPYTETVYHSSIHFSDAHAPVLGRVLTEYNRYRPSFVEIFRRERIPEYLSLYCVAETMMNNSVRKADRRGVWQLDTEHALRHGLTCSDLIDERMLREKSAEAFARELKSLKDSTGTWAFALVAYRDGLRTLANARNLSKDADGFWDVYKYLSEDTQTFLMNLMGAINSYYFGKEHGIRIRKTRLTKTETAEVTEMTVLSDYQHIVRVPLRKLTELNPQYVAQKVPGTKDQPMQIVLTKKKIKINKKAKNKK